MIYGINKGNLLESNTLETLSALIAEGYIDHKTAFDFAVNYKQDCQIDDPRSDEEIWLEILERFENGREIV